MIMELVYWIEGWDVGGVLIVLKEMFTKQYKHYTSAQAREVVYGNGNSTRVKWTVFKVSVHYTSFSV